MSYEDRAKKISLRSKPKMAYLLKKTIDINHMPLACGNVGDGVGGLRPVLPVSVEIFHFLKR